MRRTLKSIDFYHAVSSDISEGTISGACISVATVVVLTFLIIIAISQSFAPKTKFDMIVDQKHLNQKLKVNIDIQFPSYPCSMLSLDIENSLRVHQVNIRDTLRKTNLDDGSPFVEISNFQQQKKRMVQDLKSGRGCRMVGHFFIDPVPGNFHCSCHGYGGVVQTLLNQGVIRDLHKAIDLSHKINYMVFGEFDGSDSIYSYLNTFKHFESKKQIGEAFLGISYTYFLDIVESNSFDLDQKQQESLSYFYTVRMNEVILASFPMVLFRYETSPISTILVKEAQQWHILFVKLVGIIGGVFTVATILDGLIHSSIHFLLEKQRLGKLR